MLTAIIVYLIIGTGIVLYVGNAVSDVVKDTFLATKVTYYICMIIISPPLFLYGIAKGVYQELKNKSES